MGRNKTLRSLLTALSAAALFALVSSSLTPVAASSQTEHRRRPANYVNPSPQAKVHLPMTVIKPRGAHLPTTGAKASAIADPKGRWVVERRIERSTHLYDLPTTELNSDPYLSCAGSGNLNDFGDKGMTPKSVCTVVDRLKGTQIEIKVPYDLFCGTGVPMPDGSILFHGGTGAYPDQNTEVAKTWGGSAKTYRFDAFTYQFTPLGDMNNARWYNNSIDVPSRGVVTWGGLHNGKQPDRWELLRPGATTWEYIPGVSRTMGSYADQQLLNSSAFAYTGAVGSALARTPFIVDMTTATPRLINTPGLRYVGNRRSSFGLALFPWQDRKVMVGGGFDSSGLKPVAAVDIVNYKPWPAQLPSFSVGPDLPKAMGHVNAHNTCTGEVFATGGSTVWRSGDVLWAGMFNQQTNSWALMNPPSVGRDYHGESRTNLDCSESVFGGNPGRTKFYSEVETFYHAYSDGARPDLNMTTLPRETVKGSAYPVDVTVPGGQTLSYFTLDHQRGVTHASSDVGQGMFSAPFTFDAATGRALVTIPQDPTLTPGWYRLNSVARDASGKAIPAKLSAWVHVSEAAAAPAATSSRLIADFTTRTAATAQHSGCGGGGPTTSGQDNRGQLADRSEGCCC